MGSPSVFDRKTQRRWGSWKAKLLVVDQTWKTCSTIPPSSTSLVMRFGPSLATRMPLLCLAIRFSYLVVVSQGTHKFEGRSVLARAIEKDRRTPVLILPICRNSLLFGGDTTGSPRLHAKPLPRSEIAELVAMHLPPRSGSA